MIKILIVSDIKFYRDGLTEVLNRYHRVEVIGAFETIDAPLRSRKALSPDVLLLDMANANAIADLRQAHREFPGVRIVALGVVRRDGDIIACAEAGAAGYVFRDASLDELVATIESAVRGELRCSPEMAGALLRRVANLAGQRTMDGDTHLTRREHEILDLVDRGFSNKQIAIRLFITVATVKNHMHNILEKLGVHTRSEAAARARSASRTTSG